jgi:hypothetical protein
MRKALEKAYSVMHTLNTWEGAGSYEPWILLLTDGEETEQPVEQIKATVNEQVQQMRDEGIGMGVSTVSFSKDADRTHMNRIAELGGGSHLFIEQEDLLPSTPRLAVLVIEQTALQDYLTQVWKNTEFDITVVLKEGVSLNEDTLKPYNGKLPAIQDCELVYSQVKLGDLLAVDVSLSEELVQEKGAILSLSITSRDKSFSLLENYPLSLNHPVVAEYKRTLVTFSIRGEKK